MLYHNVYVDQVGDTFIENCLVWSLLNILHFVEGAWDELEYSFEEDIISWTEQVKFWISNSPTFSASLPACSRSHRNDHTCLILRSVPIWLWVPDKFSMSYLVKSSFKLAFWEEVCYWVEKWKTVIFGWVVGEMHKCWVVTPDAT